MIFGQKNINKNFANYKYHTGWLNFIFFILIFILIIIVSFFGAHLSLLNAFIIASVVCFCLNIFWFINRQKVFYNGKWKILTFIKKVKLDLFLFPCLPSQKENYGFFNVDSLADYELYFDEKIKKSKIAFLFSFCFFTIVLVVVIIFSVMDYIKK